MAGLPDDVRAIYEIHNFRHAEEILATSYPDELSDLVDALLRFRLSKEDVLVSGGNESNIPKRFSSLLRPKGWLETRLEGDLVVRSTRKRAGEGETSLREERIIKDYFDGHKIDFVKGRVAFDLEWNSKDQTFDRDLYAFRSFHEAGVIDVAILLTRSAEMDSIFRELDIRTKYGASTTWMGKLLPRLNAGRNGGCPVLALGITPRLMED